MTIGTDLAELTAGIDALYRAQLTEQSTLNAEGLIPVAVAEVAPRPLRDWSEAHDAIAALLARVPAEAEEAGRVGWLTEMTQSLASLARMFAGERIGFAERLRDQLRVAPEPIPQAILDGYRTELADALDALGYRSGDLAEDVRRWEDDTTVPEAEVIARLAAIQREAQARSRRLVVDIGDDWTEPAGVHDKPYSAYCDYPGRHVWLNLEFRYTEADLKHLATHEAFPGHLVHLARREALVAAGEMPLDGAQVVTNSASSPLFEGIADNGIALLDWIDGPQDIAGLALQRTRSALRCNAAWMVFEEGKSIEEAARAVAGPSFMDVHPMTRRLAFLSHELRAPFLFAYWCGDDAVRRFLDATRDWERPRVVRTLYDEMHTPTTLAAAAA
ncbi:hypothetical protein OG2516_00444 [Oceanicola granulosus HTCC2516]|uniref:DUF885 domain-containing protein n=1 Tax=Oceanicola granulosus (strain ATCC BAA-861 / DSM 15982 / KCTC 12143 / HTCC2516) TaxID=314256 RepID=Q2CJF1_OCEGH|nr:hypothetical protein [Oceanicola granulosus]EAR52649.1 hypothetical protein OG2516_00444 [Oceanicola granulosus HTCC2516]